MIRVRKRLLPQYSTKNLKVYAVPQYDCIRVVGIQFTGGGHAKVYPQIPDGEIWIAEELMKPIPPHKISEGKYYIFHELYEHDKMARGMSYDDAHLLSNRVEGKARKVDEATLDKMIEAEMLKNKGMIHEKSHFNGSLGLHKGSHAFHMKRERNESGRKNVLITMR